MIQNSKIEQGKWYRHPGMIDTAMKVVFVGDGKATVIWYNISGEKRKFSLGSETLDLSQFERFPYWHEQGGWIDELPTTYP